MPENGRTAVDRFKEIQTHQRIPGMVLRSNTPEEILQEIYGYLYPHFALRTLLGEVVVELGEEPSRLKFTRASLAARRSMTAQPAFPPDNQLRVFAAFCAVQ